MHSLSEKAVENAMQRNKLGGTGVHQHRSVSLALDPVGQQQFYALFHEREDFI
jgi:hypothetical protein